MKYIFLDIDGVMNSYNSFMTNYRLKGKESWDIEDETGWDPHAITTLDFLMQKVKGVQVVVHSTWRETYRLDELKKMFAKVGLAIDDVTTPGNKARSLREYVTGKSITDYVILDDMDMEDPDHQVKIDSFTGLMMSYVPKIAEKIILSASIASNIYPTSTF